MSTSGRKVQDLLHAAVGVTGQVGQALLQATGQRRLGGDHYLVGLCGHFDRLRDRAARRHLAAGGHGLGDGQGLHGQGHLHSIAGQPLPLPLTCEGRGDRYFPLPW